MAAAEPRPIQYQVSLAKAAEHIFLVRCTIPAPSPDGQRLSLPGWIPGSYLVRDYARHVLRLSAHGDGKPLAVSKMDKASWQVEACQGVLELEYEVYACDLSVRGAYLDTRRGFFNGVCLFLEVADQQQARHEVSIERPVNAGAGAWKVATAMDPIAVDEAGFGAYRSADYDELIDHPFEISDFRSGEFEVAGVRHEIVLAGRESADLERLCSDLPRVCETHRQMFDDELPMGRYLFLTNVVGEGYGGLEHRASSALITRRSDLPQAGKQEIDKAYRRFLGLVSHEYFHLWNIKRIKPAVFTPFDLRSEAYTRLLWVFEGVTSYYDDLALVRSGLITPEAYLELIADNISKVWQTPGRQRQSLADSSFDAWIKLYKPDENSPNAVISYYTKGSLVALCLDLLIRSETGHRKSLDDVMRALWRRYGKSGRGLEENGFEVLAEEISGLELKDFFDATIRTTDDPPLTDMLRRVGVTLRMLPCGDQPGGSNGDAPRCSLGLRLRDENGRAVIAAVLAGGPAAAAGLAGGDELVAVNGLRVSAANYSDLLNASAPGDRVELQIFRRDELWAIEVEVREAPATRCELSLDDDIGDAVRVARENWLGIGNHRR